ncbi:DUF4174 domain-containing protein [Aggregatimonas sangjinii]|nr:DUF4174 domain-containing protein [Aggregatimonas sangjinii]
MKTKDYFSKKIAQCYFLLITLTMLAPMTTIAQSLDDYKWKNRIVFLVGKTIDSQAMQNQLEQFRNTEEEMAERDLVLFLATRRDVFDESYEKVDIRITEIRKTARIKSDFTGVLLFGKDGGCKLKKDFQVEPEEIFDLIDGMPMRRSEIRNK